MLIFLRKSLVMLSIPKTGTHSYMDHLQSCADIVIRHPQSLKHMGMRQFVKKVLPLLPPTEEPFDYFGFVRYPADWLWSWYCYRSRDELRGSPTSTADISFSEFLDGYLAAERPAYARIGRQSMLVRSIRPSLTANRLYRYDNQAAANAYLSERLGIPVRPEKMLNQSPRRDMTISLNDIERLERAIPQEFELYESAR